MIKVINKIIDGEKSEVIKMKLLIKWLELMEYDVELITDDEIMVVDYIWSDGDITIKTIREWCEYFIEIMEYKIDQDPEYTEMVQQFTKEIQELKILGNIP